MRCGQWRKMSACTACNPAVNGGTLVKKTNVLVADDHPLIDRAVALLLENSSMICLRIAQSYAQIQRVARLMRPDVILVGVHNLLDCTEALFLQIQQASPQSKVIVLVDYTCPLCMHRLIAQGSAGYIPRSEFVKRPVDVVSAVVQRGFGLHRGSSVSQSKLLLPPPLFHLRYSLKKNT